MSQKVLAGLVGRSASWMTKVERGDRIVDKLSLLLASLIRKGLLDAAGAVCPDGADAIPSHGRDASGGLVGVGIVAAH